MLLKRRPALCVVEHIPRASIVQQGSGNSLIISRDAVESQMPYRRAILN